MAKENLFPIFKDSVWKKRGNAINITYFEDDMYGFTFPCLAESDYLQYNINDGSLNGKTLKVGCTEISCTDSNNKKAWFHIRCYNAENVKTELLDIYSGDTLLEKEITIPPDTVEVKVYLRANYSSEQYDGHITFKGVFMYDTSTMSTTSINFHKVLEQNVPQTVQKGTEHVYFSTDGNTAKMYISTIDGKIIPIGAQSNDSGGVSKYNNAYTQSYIDERKETIKQLQKSDCITFTVATDIHTRAQDGDGGRHDRCRDFIMLSEQLQLDYIAVTGDIIADKEPFDVFEYRLEKAKDIFNKCNCPWYATRGNHDYNAPTTADECVTNRDWYNSITRNMTSNSIQEIHYNKKHLQGAYHYVDDFATKHRMIFLNVFEMNEDKNGQPVTNNGSLAYTLTGLRSNLQLEWLLNEALNMEGKNDWVVSFYSHGVPFTGKGTEYHSEFHGYGFDNPELRQIVKAFQTGTNIIDLSYSCIDLDTKLWLDYKINKDFTQQGSIDVIGWFGGHTHDDCYAKVDGLNLVVCTCTCHDQRTSWRTEETTVKLPPERNSTDLAMSLNVFVVNKNTRTVNVIKVGSKRDNTIKTSSDYSFTY